MYMLRIAMLQTDTSSLVQFSVEVQKSTIYLPSFFIKHLDMAKHLDFYGKPNFSLGQVNPKSYCLSAALQLAFPRKMSLYQGQRSKW